MANTMQYYTTQYSAVQRRAWIGFKGNLSQYGRQLIEALQVNEYITVSKECMERLEKTCWVNMKHVRTLSDEERVKECAVTYALSTYPLQ